MSDRSPPASGNPYLHFRDEVLRRWRSWAEAAATGAATVHEVRNQSDGLLQQWDDALKAVRADASARDIDLAPLEAVLVRARRALDLQLLAPAKSTAAFEKHCADLNQLLLTLAVGWTPAAPANRGVSKPSLDSAGAESTESGEPAAVSATTGPGELPPLLSAADLARALQQPYSRVESFLRRHRAEFSDCFVEAEVEEGGTRKNEPHYLYRVTDVWPFLQQKLPEWRKLTDG
jgi:hypothetical protein